jgi:mannose/cellobiose epimerase-like protein (N-acyl-D-glucosamine 2-epimerase family)
LLSEYCRASGDDSVKSYAERLFAFGSQFGIDTDGAVFDGVDADGAVVAGTKLLWPQTEYIKACAARAEWFNDAASCGAMTTHLKLIAQRFMRPDGANWDNQLARDGSPAAPVTPARVLYHLFLAVAEAERVLRDRRAA